MSSNSSTKPLSITNTENGDNENLNQISSVSDTSKSQTPYPVGGSRSENTSYPPLPSSAPHSYSKIGNSSSLDLKANEPPCFGPPASPPVEHMEKLIALCLSGKVWREYVPLPAIINKTKADWKFIRGQVSYVDLENNWISFEFANLESKEMV
ncbi:hypothetical protein Cgig2_024891 [Carnegiea gigantea]|uniref:Uncharacterized protein n=1 Tax=Carnegiea gigantea TaxID=171969 RepID=A0A9Q1QGC9_9CARY|nr:hypothetical protein Cgig2_024891 [Carnegiea gigantea]